MGGGHAWQRERHLPASAAHCSRLGPARPRHPPHGAHSGKPLSHWDGRQLLTRPTVPPSRPCRRLPPCSPAPWRSHRAAPAERKCGRARRAFIAAVVTSARRATHAGKRRRSREDGGSGTGIPRGISTRCPAGGDAAARLPLPPAPTATAPPPPLEVATNPHGGPTALPSL